MTKHPRRAVALAHRWFGLGLGVFVVYLALTGAAFALRPQLDPVIYSRLNVLPACTAPLSLDELMEGARKAHPQGKLDRAMLGGDAKAPLIVRFSDDQQLYVDRCDGAIVGQMPRWSGVFGFAEYLHRVKFLKGMDPSPVTGGIALSFLLLGVFGGLYLWWPRRLRAARASMTYNGALRGRARLINLHGVTGAYAAAAMLIASLTALPLAFDWAKDGVYGLTGTSPTERPDLPDRAAGAKVAKSAIFQTAWVAARRADPEAFSTAVIRPAKKDGPIEISFVDRSAPHGEAKTYVYVDGRDGHVVDVRPYANQNLGKKILGWGLALHTGKVGGWLGAMLMFIGMSSIPFMAYTGLDAYLRRRALKARSGLRVKVVAKRLVAGSVMLIDLAPVKHRRLPRAEPGAHIDVHLNTGVRRQYSLCNGPLDRDVYRIAVKLEPRSRGGSAEMHRLAMGQSLTINVPPNAFALDRDASNVVLIAAGIGITPIWAMAQACAARGKPFALHYFGRERVAMAFADDLEQSPFADRCQLHAGLSRFLIRQSLQAALAQRQTGAAVYVCGPHDFMMLTRDLALAAGWPDESIRHEAFAAAPGLDHGEAKDFEVYLARAGQTLRVPSDRTLLEVLTDHGVEIESSCQQGVCGSCMTPVREGRPDHRDSFLSEKERARCDRMLACVSRAKTERLVLDL